MLHLFCCLEIAHVKKKNLVYNAITNKLSFTSKLASTNPSSTFEIIISCKNDPSKLERQDIEAICIDLLWIVVQNLLRMHTTYCLYIFNNFGMDECLGEILGVQDWIRSRCEFEKINPKLSDLWKNTPFATEIPHIQLFNEDPKKNCFRFYWCFLVISLCFTINLPFEFVC